jgi:hypothetical protein
MSTIRDELMKLLKEVSQETAERLAQVLTQADTMKTATGSPLDPVAVRLIGDIVTVIRENDDVNSSAIAIVAGLRTGRLKLPENSPQIQYWRDNARYWKREHEEVAGTLQSKAKECKEAQLDLATNRTEVERLKQENERLQKAHDHQHTMAGLMLREAERSLRTSLNRFQEIVRQTDKALRSIAAGVTPNIDAIQDGCIKIHLKDMLGQLYKYKEEATRVEHAKLYAQGRQEERDAAIKERDEAIRLSHQYRDERDALQETLNEALGPDKDQEAFVSAIAKERDEARADRESMHKDYLRVTQELSVTQRERDEAVRAAADRLVEVTKERDDYKKRKDDAYTERKDKLFLAIVRSLL